MGEIASQPVGDVHAGARQPHEALTQRDTGLRQALALDESAGSLASGNATSNHREPECGIADGAADSDEVAHPRGGAAQLPTRRNGAEGGQRQRERPRRRRGVAAHQGDVEFPLIRRQPGGEARKPGFVDGRGEAAGHDIGEGRSTHGREVGEVDPQHLAGDQVGRIFGKKMNAGDECIGGDDQPAPRRDIDQRRVISEPERPFPPGGERPEVAGDELEFTRSPCWVPFWSIHWGLIHLAPRARRGEARGRAGRARR